MLKHIYLIFFATFLLGFLSGVILHLNIQTSGTNIDILPKPDSLYTIVATMYGVCEKRGCPSYRIAHDGSYIYILRDKLLGETRFDGELSSDEEKVIKGFLRAIDLETLEDTQFTGTCPTLYDGVAFQYSIEYKGERYSYDSCLQELEQIEFFGVLKKYFTIFNNLSSDV